MAISEVRVEDVFKVHSGRVVNGGYDDCNFWINPGYLEVARELGCIYDARHVDLTRVKRVLRQVQKSEIDKPGSVDIQTTQRGVVVYAHEADGFYRWVFVCN